MTIEICNESIKLGQALKLSGMAESGTDAKERILSGEVKVNGKVELHRGRKLIEGDEIELDNEVIVVQRKKS